MKRILCAVDSSPNAPKVLNAAVELATRTGAKIVLFRAVGIPPELPLDLYLGSEANMSELLVAQAQKDLTAYATRIPSAVLETTAVEIGVPWDAICRAAKNLNADLVLIGSHGYGGIDRLLGTTAAKVVNHAERSVLVVRGESPFA